MSTKDKLIYSTVGFCCIMDEDKRILWSPNRRLFKRITSDKAFLNERNKLKDEWDSFVCYITFESVNFRVKTFHLPEDRSLCIAFPEECYIRYAYSEMYMRIFHIRKNANRCTASLKDVRDILIKSGIDDDTIKYIDECLVSSQKIFEDSVGISDLFDLEHICDYVDLRERLRNASSLVKRYNTTMKSDVSLVVQLKHSVARMNYNLFESALYELVRIIYKILPAGEKCEINITEDSSGSILISADTRMSRDFDERMINSEIRDVKCMFECLDGNIDFLVSGRKIKVRALAAVRLSNYMNRVKTNDYSDEHYEELKGYSRIIEAYDDTETDEAVFRSPHLEIRIDFSEVISDIMFSSLIER